MNFIFSISDYKTTFLLDTTPPNQSDLPTLLIHHHQIIHQLIASTPPAEDGATFALALVQLNINGAKFLAISQNEIARNLSRSIVS